MPPFLPSASTLIDFSTSAGLCLYNSPLHAVIGDLLLPDKTPVKAALCREPKWLPPGGHVLGVGHVLLLMATCLPSPSLP